MRSGRAWCAACQQSAEKRHLFMFSMVSTAVPLCVSKRRTVLSYEALTSRCSWLGLGLGFGLGLGLACVQPRSRRSSAPRAMLFCSEVFARSCAIAEPLCGLGVGLGLGLS